MIQVTYPVEWEKIKDLAARHDYKAIMEYASFKESDPKKIDPDEEPTLTYEFSVQSFAIGALAKFSTNEVSEFLIQKFEEYQDDSQRSDVVEALAQHQTEISDVFLQRILKEGNPEFFDAVLNGLDTAEVPVGPDTLGSLLKTAFDSDESSEFIERVFEIVARSDEHVAADLIDKEFQALSAAGTLSADQSALLQSLTDAAIIAEHQVDFGIIERLLENDGNDRNAALAARLVSSYPDSKTKAQFLDRIEADYSYSNEVMGELGMGLE